MRVPPNGFRVFFKADTGVSLNDAGDEVRLLSPSGQVMDRYAYPGNPGYDRLYSRTADGGGEWTAGYAVTPVGSNHARPAPTPEPKAKKDAQQAKAQQPRAPARLAIARARRLRLGTTVIITGQMTVPPGLFDMHTAYVQDATGGLKVYLADADLPALAEGDQVEVTGKMGSFHGEREIRPATAGDARRLGPGIPLAPQLVETGAISETLEGLLVQVSGAVTRFSPATLTLDDGSGTAVIEFREATGVRRPWVERGEV